MKSPHKLLQYQLFKSALEEESINNVDIFIDHRLGTCTINDCTINLKYPRDIVNKCNSLNFEKKFNYCFIGAFAAKANEIDRKQLLSKFYGPLSKIENTSAGRKRKDKSGFDTEYYQAIANSKYSLCPNHSGEWYLHDDAWSYRFVESCFSKSIPVLFRDTPLGKNFTKDIFFLWDDELHEVADYSKIVNYNYDKAIEYWTLQNHEINKLSKL